jgi:hypothetical protein
MDFHNLCSIVSSQKALIPVRKPTDSFGVAQGREGPYIEPAFEKMMPFEQEKPAVILISAVGATGKTTLAQVLSNQTKLPLLDLAKHKPVGDNTLTGLLTQAFSFDNLTNIFEGLSKASFGVIVDGIDEGRSKTNAKAFEAFLDDVVRLCKGAPATSFVLLGRTQVLEDCWVYLGEKGIEAGLISILPFDLDGARRYIDAFTRGDSSKQSGEYRQTRDMILDKLSAAFGKGSDASDQNFLSFIGYPPVLDAIVTLLQEEQNFYALRSALGDSCGNRVEVELLRRIAFYILRREKTQKVIPNILTPIVGELGHTEFDSIAARVFEKEEQCLRLVSHCLGRQPSLNPTHEPLIDEKYEARLASFLPEHPFISGRSFRNAIFEAVALSTLFLSRDEASIDVALEYFDCHKSNYHLVLLLDSMASDRRVPVRALRAILESSLEFATRTASVSISVEGPETDKLQSGQPFEVEIEISMGIDQERPETFQFKGDLGGTTTLELGSRFASTYVSLPCEVVMSGTQEVELIAPVEISAPRIVLQAPAIVLRAPITSLPAGTSPLPLRNQVFLEAETFASTVGKVIQNGAELTLSAGSRTGLAHPLIQFVEDRRAYPNDALLRDKFMRLRRILVEFRSHSKGTMARFKHKIENERVLKNDLGRAILKSLLEHKVVALKGSHYFLNPENVDKHLGVSWIDLRKGRTSPKLEQFLRSVA